MANMDNQKGFSFTGFIMTAVIFVFVAIVGMKLVPAFSESAKIQRAIDAIARDPSMQNASPTEIKTAFFNRAMTMDSVTAVSQEDLEIDQSAGYLALAIHYKVKIPLAGNVSLLIEYNLSAHR